MPKVNLKLLLANILDAAPEHITESATALDIPAWDSLTPLAIVAAIEEQTGIVIDEEEMPLLDSVEKICTVLRRRLVEIE